MVVGDAESHGTVGLLLAQQIEEDLPGFGGVPELVDPVGLLLDAYEIQEIEELAGKPHLLFEVHVCLARRLKHAPLVPDAFAHQNTDVLSAGERAQILVPRDADRAPRLFRQRMTGIGLAAVG